MRKAVLVLVLLSLLGAACAEEDSTTGTGSGSDQDCSTSKLPLFEAGVLTVGTDDPAFAPWFEGSPKNYSGYEGDLASEIAERLELPIKWVTVPFNKSYAPGDKDFDFDINQISITPEREEVVDFSDGYFDNNQGVLTTGGSEVTEATSLTDLKGAQLGAQVGTTSLDFINSEIQPDLDPKIYDTTNDVKSALESGQIDGLVTDVVTTVFLRDIVEIEDAEVVGQYPTNEQFGLLFEDGNPLRPCVNEVLAEIESDGTLEKLQDQWLQDYLSVPTLEN